MNGRSTAMMTTASNNFQNLRTAKPNPNPIRNHIIARTVWYVTMLSMVDKL
jgi:hypothetical protein